MTGHDDFCKDTAVSPTSSSSSGAEIDDQENLTQHHHYHHKSEESVGWLSNSSSKTSSLEDLKDEEAHWDIGRKSDEFDERDRLLHVPIPEPTQSKPGTPLLSLDEDAGPSKKPLKTSWRDLPRKDQLVLLMMSRLSEPLTQTSLQSYMFYQLKSFDKSLTDANIANQVGWMASAFTIAQFCTAFAWGRAADSEFLGRKRVIMIGLLGTMISAVGFGFSKNYTSAVFFRCVGGALNGNVGVMRVVSSSFVHVWRLSLTILR
jgi:Major Facilitator Superfamily